MEFGNLQNSIYLIFPLILLLIMILGMRKRKDILNVLKLRNKRRISIIKILLLTLGSVLVVISLLSPQKEIEDEEIEVKGMNIYVLIYTRQSARSDNIPL